MKEPGGLTQISTSPAFLSSPVLSTVLQQTACCSLLQPPLSLFPQLEQITTILSSNCPSFHSLLSTSLEIQQAQVNCSPPHTHTSPPFLLQGSFPALQLLAAALTPSLFPSQIIQIFHCNLPQPHHFILVLNSSRPLWPRKQGTYLLILTSPSFLPNLIAQSHPQVCSRRHLAVSLPFSSSSLPTHLVILATPSFSSRYFLETASQVHQKSKQASY